MRKVTLQKATSLSRESLATWLELRVTCEIQPIKDSSNSSMCFSHDLFCGSSIASPVTKTTYSQILHQTLTHSPYIKSHKNTRKWFNRIPAQLYWMNHSTWTHRSKGKATRNLKVERKRAVPKYSCKSQLLYTNCNNKVNYNKKRMKKKGGNYTLPP